MSTFYRNSSVNSHFSERIISSVRFQHSFYRITLHIMIDLENLSGEEKKAIEELRKCIENDLPKHMYEDRGFLYRFLKARDFDVDKAENMLRRHIAWRKHFQVDTILEDFTPRPFFEKYPKSCHLGLDKNGNILKYIALGNLDGRDMMKCAQMNEYMKHWVWHFEEIAAHAKKLKEKSGKTLQITLVMNLDKLTVTNATNKSSVEECIRLMRILLDNYPETLNAVYSINTPGYYVFIYSILKTMMSSAMIQKIHVYGYSGWQEKLLEVIDADVLPTFLGGNRTDPDGNPLCTTFVNHGGRVPEKYFLPEEERDFTTRSQVKRITIPPKQKKEILVHVTETGSQIHWEFLIKNKDINFGIFYEMPESELMEILPLERYDTIDGVEKGSYKSRLNGNYIIVFDNSYSWMNSKEVDYCITVLKPVSRK